MTDDRQAYVALCRAAAESLERPAHGPAPEVLVGFDGFIDHIIDLVDKRHSPTSYARIPDITAFGQRVLAAAGRSAGIGAVTKLTKLGGNGPIMANALIGHGAAVVAVGILGEGAIDPVFRPLAERARRTISLGPPAVTSALEFDDGKVMLNFSDPMATITYEHLLGRLGGRDGLRGLLQRPAAIATVNWSQTPGMTAMWRRFAEDVLPGLRADRPLWFVDLADPHRCPDDQVRDGLAALAGIQRHAEVVLGLNENECRHICRICGIAYPERGPEWEAAAEAVAAIRERWGFAYVMCHLVRSSAVAWPGGRAGSDGFFEPRPKITTGAGDHYNAGFLAGLLAGVPPAQCLQIGGATSGHYVRTGDSPGRAEVAAFLRAAAG